MSMKTSSRGNKKTQYVYSLKPQCVSSWMECINTSKTASLSCSQAPIWGPTPDSYYCQTVAGLWMWGALSDKRTIAAGPRQRGHSLVRVPSDLRLPFSSPPTTRGATVEVFDLASTRDLPHRPSVSCRQLYKYRCSHVNHFTIRNKKFWEELISRFPFTAI
jgi:hypothetical protein